MASGGGISEHSQQQNIEYFRNNLRGRIQGKNNDLRLLFLEISKLEYLANACACRDLSSDCNFQVSFLCDKAAVMHDDIDRMQLELTDLDFAIRTSIDDYAEQEQKLAYEHSNLSSLKIRSNIKLVGGGRKRKRNVQFLQIKQQYMASSPWPVQTALIMQVICH